MPRVDAPFRFWGPGHNTTTNGPSQRRVCGGPYGAFGKSRRFVQRLRVGFFTECYRPIINGVVASIDAFRDGIAAEGHHVVCIAPGFPSYEDEAGAVVRLPSLPLPTTTGYRLCVPFVSSAARAEIGALSIVHTHSPFVTGWLGERFARRHGIPHVFTYHTRLEQYAHYVPFDRSLTERAAVELTRTYANRADAVVVPTPAMEARLRSLGVSARIAIVPSAVDTDRFAAGRRQAGIRSELGCAGDERLVLCVARLAREKNIGLALEALANVSDPRMRLAVVGGGPEGDRLLHEARRLGIAARVRFLGNVEPGRLPDIYASADAFVFTSVSETQGLVLAEALAAGLPVVAVDAPVSRDVLDGAGILAAPRAAAVARAIESVFDDRRSAKHLAPQRYTVRSQARRMLELYGELVAAVA